MREDRGDQEDRAPGLWDRRGSWFDKLTMKAGCAGFVGCCWVPAEDAEMTEGEARSERRGE